ncbi:FAD/NAD(P)-binding domain-containing protein [Cryphonectria parasitica EP155]|uniref:FAD/NAD(P)-binding domain-containing protein n=1 Tax=Cryphonectria parasitica (strain ATCC 38755 / EP155) TaxID=660469 RepID=A0A9P4XWD6_CRYP1|nr:FAD/NAD(P)-binding domain-containing protein [Cryphonectria parasitica EP155]KAF3762532.1 FAD/NAD(P)-binding domain-containing protein [Cryphonectria parasitica EP155]
MGDAFQHDLLEHDDDYTSSMTYTVEEQPLGTPKHLRIVCIGAGISGINLLRTLWLNLQSYEAVVYEKNDDVGGTWFENSYPGCKCDIPSHCYQYSWRQKKDWTCFFAPSEEIKDYLCQACKDEGLVDSIKLSHQVVAARWDEPSGLWNLRIRNLKTGDQFDDTANFLINACGILNNWKWPEVEGLHDYQGSLIHTAAWPKDFDYQGKTVAVIGNGASGVQVLPAIQPGTKKLYHIVRTPTWIPPPWRQAQIAAGRGQMLKEIAVDEKENFTPEQLQRFQDDEELYRKFVKSIEKDTGSNFAMFVKDSPIQAFATAKTREYMTYMLGGDERLCKMLIPTFPIGTRRVTPAPGYLEALRKENVEVVSGNIKRFVADGIEMDSGDVLKVDAIVCATGFDLSFCPRFPVVGREGNLQDIWRNTTPKAYMSVAVQGMPNYFTFLGPNGPIAHGSVFTLSEHIAKYITRILKKVQTEHIRSLAPLPQAVDDYNEHIAHFMPRMAWAAPGRSWFKMGKEQGPVVALHPGSRVHFFHMLETLRAEDFEYVLDAERQNRFGYLGNGFSVRELEESWDPSWYLEEPATV